MTAEHKSSISVGLNSDGRIIVVTSEKVVAFGAGVARALATQLNDHADVQDPVQEIPFIHVGIQSREEGSTVSLDASRHLSMTPDEADHVAGQLLMAAKFVREHPSEPSAESKPS